jgi:hypothetical protein
MPKLKGEIIQLDTDTMVLTVTDMTFWADAKTKIEDNNSVHISFGDLEVRDWVELEYNPSQVNAEGFIYASVLLQKRLPKILRA